MWRDDAYLLEMLLAARDALTLAADITESEFLGSLRDQYAIAKAVELIGESASKVSPEKRAQYAEIPWRTIVGLRHRIVHDYQNLDLQRLWQIVQHDVPQLQQLLEVIVPPEDTR
jgi:uncharacterized protein with HEPN domain